MISIGRSGHFDLGFEFQDEESLECELDERSWVVVVGK
jgi:hypothetical protein